MNAVAKYWRSENDGSVRCLLCPHHCVISDGGHGKCLVRRNINGTLFQTAYGRICSASVDPIEKKPLYHFYPGSNILSIGTFGCNMSCAFCQNWQISTKEVKTETTAPEALIKTAKQHNSIGIAYTYNEPSIWFEFVLDCAKAFRKAGLKNVLVTNGMINPEPIKELIPFIDAVNVDLKAFTDDFYKEHGGRLNTVKESIKTYHSAKIHTEITNLVIPTKNDNISDFELMCRFIADIDKDIPLHLSRYFPQHKYEIMPTPNNTLTAFAKTAKNYLNYVYIGNADIPGWSDTYCPVCKTKLIERSGYNIKLNTDNNICPSCSCGLPFRL